MTPFATLLICLLAIMGSAATHPVMALDAAADPRISLTATHQPLGAVLDSITGDTGYRFNLNERWEDYPVSATIRNLPLEQGLKRLLRSLNHTIIWEADKTVTIMIYGKVEPGNTGPGISFASPPQPVPEDPEPSAEIERPAAEDSETIDAGEQSADGQVTAESERGPDPGDADDGNEADTVEAPPDQEPAKE
jgi:hypothetical protein